MTSSIGYDNKTKTLSVSLGVLTHASYVEYGQNGAWKVTAFEKKFTDNEANIPYYIYARCSKSNNTATIYTSESKINDDSTYFYFLIGILSSEYESARVFNKTSGLSTITGGTITTEQIQDYNRSLIIDFSSNPPRIIARNGAIIEGAIKFTSFQDNAGNEVLNDISSAANSAITKAENADAKAIQASTTAQNAQNIANQAQEDIENLDASVKPITNAIKGSTEIEGGLVNTNVLMVKDSNNAISGGISGISSDNIAFWSGGTLADAINGNCNVIIRKDGTAKIGAFLIEKGIAKIQLENGSYATMSASGIEVALANGGTATYSTSGVSVKDENNEEKIKLVDDVIDFTKFRKENVGSYSSIDAITSTSVQLFSKILTCNGNTITFNVPNPRNYTIFTMPLSAIKFRKLYSTNSLGRVEVFNVEFVLKSTNGKVIRSLRKYAIKMDTVKTGSDSPFYITYKIAKNEDIYSSTLNWDEYEAKTILATEYITLEAITFAISEKLPVTSYAIECKLTPGSSSYASGETSIMFNGTASYKVEEYEPKTIIGTNGIMNFQTSYKFFGAYLDDGDNYHIVGKGNIKLNDNMY
jgi:hypothetical protein